MTRAALLLLAVIGLGCARLEMRPAGAPPAAAVAREQWLASSLDFAVQGRIALSHQGRGGSGHFFWRQSGDRLEMVLRPPGAGGALRLSGDGRLACLEGRPEGKLCGRDPERLLSRALEVRVPLGALSWWLRGSRVPGLRAAGHWTPEGLPLEIRQGGWTIRYLRWHEEESPPLPRLIEAERSGVRVRIAVVRWERP
jgi:outer membrane lipoprotein LolB